MITIEAETAWINSLASDQKLRFLARLSFELTIAGRLSYEAGTDELANPRHLRRVNEVQHRVTGSLSQFLENTYPNGFVPSIAQWVLAEPDTELRHILQWVWIEAKEYVQGK